MIDEIKTFLMCDSDFTKKIAAQTIRINESFIAGKIKKSEYVELLYDLKLQKDTSQSLKQLAVKESLNKLIDGLIAAVV
jgi:hypothetical protein